MSYKFMDQLNVIRKEFEGTVKDLKGAGGRKVYPENFCLDVARRLKADYGFHIIEGKFIKSDGEKKVHYWSHDPDAGVYIDLTADQFDGLLPKVLIIEENSEEAKRMYQKLRSSENWLVWDVPE